MIRVYLNKQSNYPVSATVLKKRLKEYFEKEGIVSDADVNVGFVGKEKILAIAQKYLGEKDVIHNVLSFTDNEVKGEFIYPPDNTVHLGEIIVCFPKAFEEAMNENRLIDEKVWELIEHGANHLLGKHHN